MAYLGLSCKVSKHSKNDYRTTFKLPNAKNKKGLKKYLMLNKEKLLKSGGNAHSKKAKRPP